MPEIETDQNGVLKLSANLKPDKADGPGGIKPFLLKELRNEIAPVVKIVFKKSRDTGTLLKDRVPARVIIIFKKGDICDPTISLTCIS